MILGLGMPELIVILLVVLIVFGPRNLPRLGTALGKTVKNVRKGMDGESEDAGKADAVEPDAIEPPEKGK